MIGCCSTINCVLFRIKMLIRKEQGKLVQPKNNAGNGFGGGMMHHEVAQPFTRAPRFQASYTTTPRPSLPPSSVDYEYDEDYYYNDDDDEPTNNGHQIANIHRGEAIADFNVNTVDNDYEQYYYSDDGEEPEFMQFHEEDEAPRPTPRPSFGTTFAPSFSKPPFAPPPTMNMEVEDYYYDDDAAPGPQLAPQQPLRQQQHQQYQFETDYDDYEYYSDEAPSILKRRVLQHQPPPSSSSDYNGYANEAIQDQYQQSVEEGKTGGSRGTTTNTDIKKHVDRSSSPLTTTKYHDHITFSKLFLPHLRSPSSILYTLLPPPKNLARRGRKRPKKVIGQRRKASSPQKKRRRANKSSNRRKVEEMAVEIVEAETVRPWWSHFRSLTLQTPAPNAMIKQQRTSSISENEPDEGLLKIPVTSGRRRSRPHAAKPSPKKDFFNGHQSMIGKNHESTTMTKKLFDKLLFALDKEAYFPAKLPTRGSTDHSVDQSLIYEENASSLDAFKLNHMISKRRGMGLDAKKGSTSSSRKQQQQLRTGRRRWRNTSRSNINRKKQKKNNRHRHRHRYGTRLKEARENQQKKGKVTTTKNKAEIRTLIKDVFHDLDEMDSLSLLVDDYEEDVPNYDDDDANTDNTEIAPLAPMYLTPDISPMTSWPIIDEVETQNQEEEEASWEDKAVRSWHQKLHLAKLASWMKAKAQIEASHLAESMVMAAMEQQKKNVKKDYEVLPQGEDPKIPKFKSRTTTTTTTEAQRLPMKQGTLDGIMLELGVIEDQVKEPPEHKQPQDFQSGSFDFSLDLMDDEKGGSNVEEMPKVNKTTSSSGSGLEVDGITFLPDSEEEEDIYTNTFPGTYQGGEEKDGFIYDDFYDDNFPLVDDAVIEFQEEQWSDEGPSKHPIIIHDGSNRQQQHHFPPHYQPHDLDFTTIDFPDNILPVRQQHHPSADKGHGQHGNFDAPTLCYLPPCHQGHKPVDIYDATESTGHYDHHHGHHGPLKAVYPNLIARRRPPNLFTRPAKIEPPLPPLIPTYIGPYTDATTSHSYSTFSSSHLPPKAVELKNHHTTHDHISSAFSTSSPEDEEKRWSLGTPTDSIDHPTTTAGHLPFDVAHHGSVGLHTKNVYLPPPSSRTTSTTAKPASQVSTNRIITFQPHPTYVSSTPSFLTSSTTDPYSTLAPPSHSSTITITTTTQKPTIVIQTATTQQPYFVLLQKKKKNTTTPPPLKSQSPIITQGLQHFSFSSAFLSQLPIIKAPSISQEPEGVDQQTIPAIHVGQFLEEKHDTISSSSWPSLLLGPVTAVPGRSVSASPSYNEDDSSGSNRMAPITTSPVQMSLIVPCLHPETGQKKSCLLVRSRN